MSMPILIAPSILSADFARLGDEIEDAGADWIHCDVEGNLMQCREQRVPEVVLIDAGGDANVASRKSGAERMIGKAPAIKKTSKSSLQAQ